jgi:hypothetical protein
VAAVAGKLRIIYACKGIKPADVVADIQREPGIAQDLLSKDVENPKAYEKKSGVASH